MSNNDYDYENAGYSAFLTRSIDDGPATNLEELGQTPTIASRSLNYDQSPTTGAVGSSFKTGPITMDGVGGTFVVNNDNGLETVRIDKNGILISDNGTPRGRFGFKDNDFAIKVSQKGQNVLSVTDDKQVMSSNFNLFKIVDTNTVTLLSTGSTTGPVPIVTTYSHGLGYTPGIIAYSDDPGGSRFSIPYTLYNVVTGVIRVRIYTEIDSQTVKFIYQDWAGEGPFQYNIKFYLTRETSS